MPLTKSSSSLLYLFCSSLKPSQIHNTGKIKGQKCPLYVQVPMIICVFIQPRTLMVHNCIQIPNMANIALCILLLTNVSPLMIEQKIINHTKFICGQNLTTTALPNIFHQQIPQVYSTLVSIMRVQSPWLTSERVWPFTSTHVSNITSGYIYQTITSTLLWTNDIKTFNIH